ncbi:MAG: hypothetical protein JWQ02_1431 [Capsulimonas sp.]|nr:hypothetical protein [Capsulimonas sp.]
MKKIKVNSLAPILAFAIVALAPSPVRAQSPSEDVSDTRESPLHVKGDVQRVPFHLHNEFIMIDANVNGTKGQFMFDTGSNSPISLHDRNLKLPPAEIVGYGFLGSGQKFNSTNHPQIQHLSIGAMSYKNLTGVPGEDGDHLDDIPNYLGLLGYHFFNEHLFKLDYQKKTITFYQSTMARRSSQDFLKGETVLAVLPFVTRQYPNVPMINVKIGTVDFLGIFDTGQIGIVSMNHDTQEALKKQQSLTAVNGEDTFAQLSNVHLTDTFVTSIIGAPVFYEPIAGYKPLGITEDNVLNFGYSFLHNYKTVWDYPEKKIYILKASNSLPDTKSR